MTTSKEMPRWQCHKLVWALQIESIVASLTGASLYPVDQSYGPILVDSEWIGKHQPHPNGYYVVYDDGYTSYSPQDAFESGYTLIDEEST